MTNKFIGSIILLIMVLFVSLAINKHTETFSNNKEHISAVITDNPLLDDYPLIGKTTTSNNTYNKIWWKYPTFKVGSYEQITNNLKYYKNPDEGNCVRADFCGALYHDKKQMPTNIIKPLPLAEEGEGARVGYFRTEPNELFFSIPTNENILY